MDWLTVLGLFVVLVLAAERVGGAVMRFRLPLITGFLLAGLLTGPFVLGILSPEQIARLRIVDELAFCGRGRFSPELDLAGAGRAAAGAGQRSSLDEVEARLSS